MSTTEDFLVGYNGCHFSYSLFTIISKREVTENQDPEFFMQLNFEELIYHLKGVSCLYHFCTDYRRLSHILELYAIYDPRLICMALFDYCAASSDIMKDQESARKGKIGNEALKEEFVYESALDRTIRKRTNKCIELILSYFPLMQDDYNLSRLVYKQFTPLL